MVRVLASHYANTLLNSVVPLCVLTIAYNGWQLNAVGDLEHEIINLKIK